MENLKNWLNRNSFNFEVKEGFTGNELIFINIETLAAGQVKRIKTYLKRYKFNFEYRCNYTFILAYKEENKNSSEVENVNKKELRPIYNSDIEGHEDYQKEQLKIYNSGNLNFTHKRINNKMIEEYTKYFVYKDNTFMSVKPGKDYPSGYYDHVRKYNYKIDHVNKVILFTDKEIKEVEPIKNNLGGKNMNINKERYFKSMNPGHKDFILINGDKAIIKHLEGSKVWEVKEKDIIKDLGHKNENAYIKHLKKFNYVEVKEPIKEEFYFNNDNKNKVEIIAKYDNKTLCKEGNFYFINKLDYVDMKGTKEKLIKELKRWSTEVDKNNTYMLQLEKYFIDILENIQDAEQTEQEQQIKENNNYITLTEEQKKERIELINLWNTKAPGDKEQGKERFLQLLFEYQEKKKTKEELKKHINKLYAANKNIIEANKRKEGINNYLVDLLATEDILQQNDIIKNEFFTNAYNYIKSVS